MSSDDVDDETGGDAACWAQLLCEECGAVLEGGVHVAGCSQPDPGGESPGGRATA